MTLPEIISLVCEKLQQAEFVHAMWLEGSYATGKFREDSDIDVWLDVDDDSFYDAFQLFKAALDEHNLLRRYEDLVAYSEKPKLRKAKFYLVDKTDEQRIELDIQMHSREFIFSKTEHHIQILFDKDQTIKWQP